MTHHHAFQKAAKGSLFRALRHRNYRLFFSGQAISLIGTWLQQVALSWLVYRMTHSPFMLGLVGFVGMIPTFVCTPFAGVFADRHDRRRMLVVTQTLSMVQASILAFLFFAHLLAIWHVILLSAFIGIVNSFDIPIRQSFTVEMIEDREDLGNAIALNSSMLNGARLIGPSIAGILIAFTGEGVCFLLNAVSYIAVIASLLAMKTVSMKKAPSGKPMLPELRDGFGYAFGFLPIRLILLLLSLVSLTGVSYQVLMPVFARDIFHGGANTLGFLMAASGFGALVGALYLASRKSVIGLGRIIGRTAGLFGVSLIVFSLTRDLRVALPVMFFGGFGMMVQMASSNTVLQTVVDEDKRGRVMALYTMAFMGVAPFGSLLAGGLAGKIGAPATLCCNGICCLLGAMVFLSKMPAIRKEIRPVYAQKGIIPEVAQGIQSATGLKGLAQE